MTAIEVRRGDDRFRTRVPGRDTRHSFSFGQHYDPARTGFGLLQACNEDRLAPGAGYAPHEHRGIEIVTWMLEGVLHHDDSHGHRAEVRTRRGPGAQRRSWRDPCRARCPRRTGAPACRCGSRPSAPDAAPTYAHRDVTPLLAAGRWVAVAGGCPQDAAAVPVRQAAACLRVARMAGGSQLPLPTAPAVYVHVARGQVDVEACGALTAGDAALLTDTAGEGVVANGPAELLAWEMQSPHQAGRRVG